jgi:hypothetical protein
MVGSVIGFHEVYEGYIQVKVVLAAEVEKGF